MRLKLICCQSFSRGLGELLHRTPHAVDVCFLPKGLHHLPAVAILHRFQEYVDAVAKTHFDYVVMAPGFCSHGVAGLKARGLPVILPRMDDHPPQSRGSSGGGSSWANPSFGRPSPTVRRLDVASEWSAPHPSDPIFLFDRLHSQMGQLRVLLLGAWEDPHCVMIRPGGIWNPPSGRLSEENPAGWHGTAAGFQNARPIDRRAP